MDGYLREDILRLVQDEDVEFVRLQFTDILGSLKNTAITVSQLEKALNNQCSFESSAINGYRNKERSDLYLHPVLDTFTIFPWRPQQGKVARLLCDVYCSDGTPFLGDSRYILKKAVQEAEKEGYSLQAGPKCEFFLFHTDENGQPTTLTHEQAGYYDIAPLDLGENARRDMVLTLEDMGFEIESSHHKAAPAQHGIDFRHDDALKTADNIVTFKLAVKTIAKRHGLHATFMPKPRYGAGGSGMHIDISLLRDGKNIFADEKGKSGLSGEAVYFMGGIMKHAKGMAAITNPLVNSYKRLMQDWGTVQNTTKENLLIRIPAERGEAARMELRFPDSSANPYLTLAVIFCAGMEGIRNKILPPENFRALPLSLGEAIREMERDSFIRKVLGDCAYENYLEEKREEWNDYGSRITDWEIDRYLRQF